MVELCQVGKSQYETLGRRRYQRGRRLDALRTRC
jgi:hypothetical protein